MAWIHPHRHPEADTRSAETQPPPTVVPQEQGQPIEEVEEEEPMTEDEKNMLEIASNLKEAQEKVIRRECQVITCPNVIWW